MNWSAFVPFRERSAPWCLYNISGNTACIKSGLQGSHFHSVPCGQESHYTKALKLMRSPKTGAAMMSWCCLHVDSEV